MRKEITLCECDECGKTEELKKGDKSNFINIDLLQATMPEDKAKKIENKDLCGRDCFFRFVAKELGLSLEIAMLQPQQPPVNPEPKLEVVPSQQGNYQNVNREELRYAENQRPMPRNDYQNNQRPIPVTNNMNQQPSNFFGEPKEPVGQYHNQPQPMNPDYNQPQANDNRQGFSEKVEQPKPKEEPKKKGFSLNPFKKG